MARYLVTGVAGFIGSSIARSLILRGDQVSGIDSLATGSLTNLYPLLHAVRFFRGDIREKDLLGKAMEGVDSIFHEAAVASFQKSNENPSEMEEINFTSIYPLMDMARIHKVRRIIFASSSEVYGSTSALPMVEHAIPVPLSLYARQKLDAEQALKQTSCNGNLETVLLRYFNVYGPRQSSSSPYSGVIARLVRLMLFPDSNPPPQIYGDGEQTRDFVYIDDVVAANLAAASAPTEQVSGLAFNIASGVSYSINEIADLITQYTGYHRGIEHACARSGEIRKSLANICFAKECMGYSPTIDITEGLGRTIEWYRHNESSKHGVHFTIASPSINSLRQREQKGLLDDLAEAVACGNFKVLFQPILNLQEDRIAGAEALLRWQNRGKSVPASRFIPMAEEAGLMDKLGIWVIRHACGIMGPAISKFGPEFRLSVKASPMMFESDHVCTSISNALQEAAISPVNFDIEITERTSIQDWAKIGKTVDVINQMGVSITLDDFGVGYSKMESLCQLRVNRLKIDRSISTRLRTPQPVFEGIVAMARKLGISTIAEGVQTSRQLDRARAAECDEAQGFFIAKPMQLPELVDFVDGRSSYARHITRTSRSRSCS